MLLIGALAGCQGVSGPLVYGNTQGGSASICSPAAPGEAILIGDSFTTPGSDIRIDSVELVEPDGMALDNVWLTAEGGAVGSAEFPPTDLPFWEERVPALGAVVPAETLQTIAFLVRRESDEPATAAAFAISYTIGPWAFRNTGTLSVELRDKCS